jgi:GntR family transcriptional regulator, transcriptional repressor for pyruvate dehydrogenase complex
MNSDRRKHFGSLTEQVVSHISSLMESGSLGPGEKLPPESEIVRQQGVSRTVVREAISRLQAAGLLVTRHGIGSFVRTPEQKADFGLYRKKENIANDVMQALELRIGLETEAAALAAIRHTNDHLEAMKHAMQAFVGEMHSGREAVEPDVQFHHAIAKAAGNSYFVDILSRLGESSIPRSRILIDEREPERQEFLKRLNNEHEDIFSAVRRGDPESSRAAMRNHLSNSLERMKRDLELLKAANTEN